LQLESIAIFSVHNKLGVIGGEMKYFMLFIMLISALYSQDILDTGRNKISCKIIAADSTHIALIAEGQDKVTTAYVRVIETLTLESGETIIEDNQLSLGTDHRLWHDGAASLVGKQQITAENILPHAITTPKTSDLVVQHLQPPKGKGSNHKLGKIGGVLIGISGGLGLYIINAEYDGPGATYDIETGKLTIPQELQDWDDKINTLQNLRYATLCAGGIMIAISIEI
jgi:hypothetical protein